MNEKTSFRILVVDDEEDMLETCRKILSLGPYAVEVSGRPEKALELFRRNPHDLAIIDLRMPGMDGLELMEQLRRISPEQLVVMITAYASAENAIHAVRSGAFDFVRKPFKMDELLVIVERALRFKALQDENRKLQQRLTNSFEAPEIVGMSRALKKALVRLQKVCEVDVPVLISGESGVGKELFARTIHLNSSRKGKDFLAVDCAALPEPLLESELFGYEKGAFTGAVQSKAGLFEAASPGTVFLDEIGEMPLNLQVKLLRCLQENAVRRVGGNQERSIDVRILAATNRPIQAMVRDGRFREDLFYRLNVVQIVVPPLREREGDIPMLARHFFELFCSRLSRKLEGISSAAMLIMEAYDWPGNVRELRNVIERACTLTESTQILPQDLPDNILSAVREAGPQAEGGDFHRAKQSVLAQFEQQYLAAMLRRTGGNVTEAARFSGLSRPAFHRLMSKHGVRSSEFKEESGEDGLLRSEE